MKRRRRRRAVGPISRHFPGYQAGASLKQELEKMHRDRAASTSPVTKPGPH